MSFLAVQTESVRQINQYVTMSVPNNQIFHKSDPGQQENPYMWLMKRRTMAARISLPSAYRPASSVDVAVQKTVNHRIKRSSFYSFLCGKYLKTKKKAIPMTTPRPAIPRENFIQHEHRDSDPALKKMPESRPEDALGTLVKLVQTVCTKYLTLLHCEISD